MQASAPASPFVKMSTLARLSGVPAATIKHYLREGLLPQAALKTGRNMAFYDPGLSDRIRRIKTLQREQFLPLRVIKSVLDGKPSAEDDAEAAHAIERALASMAPHDAHARGARRVRRTGARSRAPRGARTHRRHAGGGRRHVQR